MLQLVPVVADEQVPAIRPASVAGYGEQFYM